jgi:hypothetical protein
MGLRFVDKGRRCPLAARSNLSLAARSNLYLALLTDLNRLRKGLYWLRSDPSLALHLGFINDAIDDLELVIEPLILFC